MKKNILNLIRAKQQAPIPLRWCFFLCSQIWSLIIRIRHIAYDWGLLKIKRAPLPTFSVGNIAIGGTGKTPLVHLLAELLSEKGKVAILTRGFKSKFEKARRPVQISAGKGPIYSAQECGDEPFFLSLHTSASIWVSPDRSASARLAHAEGAVCLLLDDGMQHRKIARDLEIVTVDGTDPLGGGRLVPAGRLRDLPQRLRHADLIVATHVRDHAHYEEVKKQLSVYTQAPVVATDHIARDPSLVAGRKVGAFCGIGVPDHFYEMLETLGAEPVGMLSLLDHEAATEKELSAFAGYCKERGAEILVCTEKDAVKLPKQLILSLPVIPIAVRLEITAGREHWEAVIEKMKKEIL